jgi:hypothetical protein
MPFSDRHHDVRLSVHRRPGTIADRHLRQLLRLPRVGGGHWDVLPGHVLRQVADNSGVSPRKRHELVKYSAEASTKIFKKLRS